MDADATQRAVARVRSWPAERRRRSNLDLLEPAPLFDIEVASANAKSLTASLGAFSKGLTEPGQLPYDLVHDEQIVPKVRDAVASLQGVADKASTVVDQVSATLGEEASPLGVLLHDDASGQDVRAALDNLATTTALLNEDLIAIRSNFLFRPYFKKAEREAAKAAKEAAKQAQ